MCEQTSKQANKQSNDKRIPSGKGRPKAFQPQFGKFYYDNKSKPGECKGELLAIDSNAGKGGLERVANSRKMFYVPANSHTTQQTTTKGS